MDHCSAQSLVMSYWHHYLVWCRKLPDILLPHIIGWRTDFEAPKAAFSFSSFSYFCYLKEYVFLSLFYFHFFFYYLTEKSNFLLSLHIDTTVWLAAGKIDMGNRSNFISCQTERILLSVIFSFIILTRELLFLCYVDDASGEYNYL